MQLLLPNTTMYSNNILNHYNNDIYELFALYDNNLNFQIISSFLFLDTIFINNTGIIFKIIEIIILIIQIV